MQSFVVHWGYLALFLILWCLVFRGISVEVGGHIDNPLWRSFWDFFFTLSSFFFLRSYTYPILLSGSFLHGMAVGVALPLWSYLTARVFGSRYVGRVFGLMTIVVTPISLLAPPVLGRIFDRTGAYDYAFILYICLGLAAFVLVPRLRVAVLPPVLTAIAH